jgi:hypothetical protein
MLGRGWIAQALDIADVAAISAGILTMRALEVHRRLPPTKSTWQSCTCRRSSRSTANHCVHVRSAGVLGCHRRTSLDHRRVGCDGAGARTSAPDVFCQIALPDALPDAGAVPTLHDRSEISTDPICTTPKRALG